MSLIQALTRFASHVSCKECGDCFVEKDNVLRYGTIEGDENLIACARCCDLDTLIEVQLMVPISDTPIEAKVRAQCARFEAELPQLLVTHRNKWVVYLDGNCHFEDTEREAIRWAFKNYEPDAGFVVAQVTESRMYNV